MSVKNHPCLNPVKDGESLGDLGRKIVENNKALCSLEFLVLLGQAKRTGNFALNSVPMPGRISFGLFDCTIADGRYSISEGYQGLLLLFLEGSENLLRWGYV